MTRAGLAALSAGLILAGAAPARAAASMEDAANGFLAVYGSFHPSDGIPDMAGRARYAPFLSQRLARLLADGDAAEKRFAAKVKNAPPLIEGDLFTSMFEGATGWKLGACAGDGKTGHCPVAFTHADAGQKAVSWTDTLLLVQTPAGWRVDDVVYGAGFAFGNTGRLSQTLAAVLTQTQ